MSTTSAPVSNVPDLVCPGRAPFTGVPLPAVPLTAAGPVAESAADTLVAQRLWAALPIRDRERAIRRSGRGLLDAVDHLSFTGRPSGIGRAIATALRDAGALVAIGDVDDRLAAATAAELGVRGVRVSTVLPSFTNTELVAARCSSTSAPTGPPTRGGSPPSRRGESIPSPGRFLSTAPGAPPGTGRSNEGVRKPDGSG